jgi:hypothetical protein
MKSFTVSRISLFVIGSAFLLSSCATQPTAEAHDAPSFISGLLHGFLSLFSLIGSFFWDIRVYAFPNSGRWYDVGFVIGAACFFGAVGRSSFEESYVLGYQGGKEAG